VHHAMNGERTGKTYRLADRIKVKVARVDLDATKIDFVLADVDAQRAAPVKQRPAERKQKTGR